MKHKLTEEQTGTGALACIFESCITSQTVYFFGAFFSNSRSREKMPYNQDRTYQPLWSSGVAPSDSDK
jgi:hypothetical protein